MHQILYHSKILQLEVVFRSSKLYMLYSTYLSTAVQYCVWGRGSRYVFPDFSSVQPLCPLLSAVAIKYPDRSDANITSFILSPVTCLLYTVAWCFWGVFVGVYFQEFSAVHCTDPTAYWLIQCHSRGALVNAIMGLWGSNIIEGNGFRGNIVLVW
jgi:hypothetical protein